MRIDPIDLFRRETWQRTHDCASVCPLVCVCLCARVCAWARHARNSCEKSKRASDLTGAHTDVVCMLTRDCQVLTTAAEADCKMETSEQQGYGADQMFCLRWSNHQTNLLNVFNQLRHNESFVDVTLAVDGRVLKAHKMVLSACSPYFQKMFEMTPDKHPVVFIDRVFYQDMKRLLEFMYRGEVSVDQETLNRFLKVARSLRIRGLTEIEEPLAEPSHFIPNGDPSVTPSIEESCRQRLAEQMAAAALAECRTSRHSSATIRLTSEPEPRSRSASGEAPRKLRRIHSERPRQPAAHDSLKIELERPLHAESDDNNQRLGSEDGCRTASEAVAQDLTSDTDRDRSETESSPHLIKQEQDVFCQPDIWISEGIFVDGQNAPSGASGGPTGGGGPSAVPGASSAHTSQSGGRSTASPPSALEEFMSSPEEPGTLLDYITHDDGSVTCKLCGEQVPSRNHWYRHKYRTHAWHTYKCDDCGITYKSKRGFEAHLEAKHDRPPPERRERDVGRRRDWEGMARAIEDTRKKREEELVSDIINRVKRECAMEGGDYTRRGYLKHF